MAGHGDKSFVGLARAAYSAGIALCATIEAAHE